MTPKSIDEALRDRVGLAVRGARDLRLVEVIESKETPKLARYLLRGRWWSWVEIVVLHHGHLLVHGDIDAVIFGVCGGYQTARAVLYWMANAGADYAREKAHIGSSGKIATDWESELALWYVKDMESQGELSEDQASELRDNLSLHDNQKEFLDCLCELIDDPIDYWHAGEITSQAVFNAQASLRALVRELENRDMQSSARKWFQSAETRDPYLRAGIYDWAGAP